MPASAVIRYYQFGNPADVLQPVYKRIRMPGEGQVLVRMTARPVNPSDLIPVRGAYPHRTPLPSVPGYEGVGTVEAIGPSVAPSLLGKRVLPLRGEGTWQERVIASAGLAVPVPDSLDDDTASQLYINPVTAWVICTETLHLTDGDFLAVNACGSSIGRIFAQLSAVQGFRLIAITRNARHTQALQELGASHVINTAEADAPSVREAILTITGGRGAAAAIDSVGGTEGEELAYCIRPGGTVLSIGLLSGIPVHWGKVSKEANTAAGLFWLRNWVHQTSVRKWHETFGKVIELVEQKKLRFSGISGRFDLAQVKEAVLAAESPGRQGKILLTSRVN
ncbi:MAG: quinone oxidoreductase 1 [Paenibacillus sp.]|nr:quinone oxidoreductase 1 [Paenibacillus sp.]